MLQDEVERRDSKQLDLRLHRANFEHERTLEDFDFAFNPSIPKTKVIDLATCAFVRKRENVLLIGPAGVGKSHLAQAIGHRACRGGHKVLCVGANDMMKQLRAARGSGTYDRRLLRFTTPDVLIIDDLGLRPLQGDEPPDLYEIIRQRYERGSIVLTSNRAVDELAALFGDALLASATMDRLVHHSHVLINEGDSYRNPPSNRRSPVAPRKRSPNESQPKTSGSLSPSPRSQVNLSNPLTRSPSIGGSLSPSRAWSVRPFVDTSAARHRVTAPLNGPTCRHATTQSASQQIRDKDATSALPLLQHKNRTHPLSSGVEHCR